MEITQEQLFRVSFASKLMRMREGRLLLYDWIWNCYFGPRKYVVFVLFVRTLGTGSISLKCVSNGSVNIISIEGVIF